MSDWFQASVWHQTSIGLSSKSLVPGGGSLAPFEVRAEQLVVWLLLLILKLAQGKLVRHSKGKREVPHHHSISLYDLLKLRPLYRRVLLHCLRLM